MNVMSRCLPIIFEFRHTKMMCPSRSQSYSSAGGRESQLDFGGAFIATVFRLMPFRDFIYRRIASSKESSLEKTAFPRILARQSRTLNANLDLGEHLNHPVRGEAQTSQCRLDISR